MSDASPKPFSTAQRAPFVSTLLSSPGLRRILPFEPTPAGYFIIKDLDEVLYPREHFLFCQVAPEESYASIDVVAYTARGDDPLLQVKGRDPADREAVTGMDVRHCQRCFFDAGQCRDIGDLFY